MLISQTPQFEIHRLYAHNSLRNYTYVLIGSASKQCIVIDPWDGEIIVAWAKSKQVTLSGILNTHLHHDHIRGNDYLVKIGIPLISKFEDFLKGIAKKETWQAPGHTMEHRVFYLEDGQSKHLFVGDTLFQAGVGNCKNGGDPKVLFQTIKSLSQKLAEDVFLHPGHDYLERNLAFAAHVDPKNQLVTEIIAKLDSARTYELAALDWKTELKINPFLRTNSQAIIENLVSNFGLLAKPPTSDQMVFIALRQLRDNW